jgi:hypothetical protein
MRQLIFLLVCLACLAGLAGCSPAAPAGSTEAVAALTTYLKALADKDEAKLTSLTCPDFQTDALMEYDSFLAVDTRLDGLACTPAGSEGSGVLVSCKGKIMARYVDQTQAFDLDGRVYRLEKNEAGWQVCGYTMK